MFIALLLILFVIALLVSVWADDNLDHDERIVANFMVWTMLYLGIALIIVQMAMTNA